MRREAPGASQADDVSSMPVSQPMPDPIQAQESASDSKPASNDDTAADSKMPSAGENADEPAAPARLRQRGSTSSESHTSQLSVADEPPAMQWDQLDASPLDRNFGTGYASGRVWDSLLAHGAAGDTKPPKAAWEDVQQGGGLAALTNAVLGRTLSPSGTTIAAVVAALLFLVALGGAISLTVVCLYEGRCGADALPSATPVADTLFVVFSLWVLFLVLPVVAVSLTLHRQGPMAWAVLLTGLSSGATFVTGIVALADTAEDNIARVSGELWPTLSPVAQSFFGGSQDNFKDSLREGSAVYGSLGFVFGVLLGLLALGCAYLFFAWGGWWEDKLWCCCPIGGWRLAGGDMDASRGVGVFGGAQRSQQPVPRGTGASAAQAPTPTAGAAADVGDSKTNEGGDAEAGGGGGGAGRGGGAAVSQDSGASDFRRMGMPRVVEDSSSTPAADGGAPERKPGGRSAGALAARGRRQRAAAGDEQGPTAHSGEPASGSGRRLLEEGGSTEARGGWRRQGSAASGDSSAGEQGEERVGQSGDRDNLLSSPGRASVSRRRLEQS